MKRCPECKKELMEFKTGERIIYSHPQSECKYQDDGIDLKMEIVDEILCNAFQEIIKEESYEEIAKEAKEIINETNEDKIKKRLAEGDINIYEFDEIKRRL